MVRVTVGVTEALPPVEPTAYVVPAQTTNLSRRLGVVMLPEPSLLATVCPLHKAHPEGIEAELPDHMVTTPVGTRAVLSWLWVDVTAPVIFGKVALRTALSSRMWSSA